MTRFGQQEAVDAGARRLDPAKAATRLDDFLGEPCHQHLGGGDETYRFLRRRRHEDLMAVGQVPQLVDLCVGEGVVDYDAHGTLGSGEWQADKIGGARPLAPKASPSMLWLTGSRISLQEDPTWAYILDRLHWAGLPRGIT